MLYQTKVGMFEPLFFIVSGERKSNKKETTAFSDADVEDGMCEGKKMDHVIIIQEII